MIAGIFHEGSGLGDQLFRYITVRTLAEEKGYDWGMIGLDNFKGDFLDIKDHPSKEFLTIEVEAPEEVKKWNEKDVRDAQGNDIRSYDPEINFVQDNTIIDGSFEDSKYWGHNLKSINEWLKVESLEFADNICIISHRGGEYKLYPDLYLPDSYWHRAVQQMREVNPNMEFQVQTDDPEEARRIFPGFNVIENQQISHSLHSNMAYNWRAIRYAPYLIVGNSAFSIIPSLLSPAKVILAPRYHAGYNVGFWKRPACYYPQFTYIHASDTQ